MRFRDFRMRLKQMTRRIFDESKMKFDKIDRIEIDFVARIKVEIADRIEIDFVDSMKVDFAERAKI